MSDRLEGFPALASISQACNIFPKSGVSTTSSIVLPGSDATPVQRKLPTKCSARLPRDNSRIPKQPPANKGALTPRDMARRWLTGIGIGAGGITFVRLLTTKVVNISYNMRVGSISPG